MPVEPIGPLSGSPAVQADGYTPARERGSAGQSGDHPEQHDRVVISAEGRRKAARDEEMTLHLSPEELRRLVQGENPEMRKSGHDD